MSTLKILVVGNGGREHGLVWAARKSPRVGEILAAPGSAGMSSLARCIPVASDNVEELVGLAREEKPDLVLIGPEKPLTLGLADRLAAAGIPAFGPSAAAARLEGSKTFAKEFMLRHRIPTARYRVCESAEEALEALDGFGLPVVVKADGLAAGKGVTVALTRESAAEAIRAALVDRIFGEAGNRVVLEEYLAGEEASVLAFCDGRNVVPMPAAQDHKRIYDGDQGPNTGGMGAYAPAPVVTPALQERVMREILEPTVLGMAAEGHPYQGVLYAGLMITPEGPKVIEYNCRFGDPETQVLLPLLESDILDIAFACLRRELSPGQVRWSLGSAVCVVLAAGGYPGPCAGGQIISGLEAAEKVPGVRVWHAGTARRQGDWVTAGGRVLNIIGQAPSVREAVRRAYSAVGRISFSGMQYRKDIAHRILQAPTTNQGSRP